MATPDMKEIKTIVDWVNATEDVRELSLKVGDVELFISKNRASAVPIAPAVPVAVAAPVAAEPVPAAPAPVPAPAAPAAPAPVPAAPAPADAVAELAADEVYVKAPMVGVFYASPKPGSPAFVSVGDAVAEDTVLGIVEVMKLMNNLEAKVAGRVVRILVENEQAVEFGQPLMVIKRSA